jgi:hypothetical protein
MIGSFVCGAGGQLLLGSALGRTSTNNAERRRLSKSATTQKAQNQVRDFAELLARRGDAAALPPATVAYRPVSQTTFRSPRRIARSASRGARFTTQK